jgi:hypothetical protein
MRHEPYREINQTDACKLEESFHCTPTVPESTTVPVIVHPAGAEELMVKVPLWTAELVYPEAVARALSVVVTAIDTGAE